MAENRWLYSLLLSLAAMLVVGFTSTQGQGKNKPRPRVRDLVNTKTRNLLVRGIMQMIPKHMKDPG